MDEPINLVLFSGTDDKLQAAAVLTAGAAALGKPVNIFLQYWALDAFRADRIGRDHGLAPEAGTEGRAAVRRTVRRPGRPLGGDASPGQGPRRGRHPGLLAVDGPAQARGRGPRSAGRWRRGRDRLLPQRRRGPARLHLATPSTAKECVTCQSSRSPQTVDARGLSCPMPIVKTAQAVKALPSGAVIELLATDAGSIKDVAAWCRSTGQRAHRAVVRRRGLPLRHPPQVRPRDDHPDARPVRPAGRSHRRRRGLARVRRASPEPDRSSRSPTSRSPRGRQGLPDHRLQRRPREGLGDA